MLHPPLRLIWSTRGTSFLVRAVVDGTVIAQHLDRGHLIGIDRNGRRVWNSKGLVGGLCVLGKSCVVQVTSGGRETIERWAAESGQREQVVQEDANVMGLATGRSIVAYASDRRSILALDATSLSRRWEVPVVPAAKGVDDWEMDYLGEVSKNLALTYLVSPSRGEGRLLAHDVRSGAHVWSRPIRGVDSAQKGRRQLAISEDRVILENRSGIAAFELGSGRPVWQASVGGLRSLFGHRVYVKLASELVVLDAGSGKTIWSREYPEFAAGERPDRLVGYPAVSESHIYVPDINGTLHAFDANTGERSWHHRPAGLKGDWGYWYMVRPYVADGRLYIETEGAGARLLCYEDVARADAGAASSTPSGLLRPILSLDVVEVARNQSITHRAPYVTGRGRWTVLKCVSGGMALCLAIRERPAKGRFPVVEGCIWVPTVEDGDRLLAAIGNALYERSVGFGRAVRTKRPVRMTVAEHPEPRVAGMSGDGQWRDSTWTGPSGQPRLGVCWSLAERRCLLVEEEVRHRTGLVDLVAGLVVRSHTRPSRRRPEPRCGGDQPRSSVAKKHK